MKKKFCRGILSLIFTAMLCMQIPAQYKALKVGDTLPEEVWTTPLQLVNSHQKTLQLGKERDKLILLDFWATWCAACLKNSPKMTALEKQFEGQLKVVPVTTESRMVLDKFFASKNGQRYKQLESVVGDKMLSELFPHVAIPFMVWIKNGKVISTTDAEQVTPLSIEATLKGEKTSLQTVVQIDRNRPLMLAEQFDLEKGTTLKNYVLFSKGRIRAIAPGSGFHRQGLLTYGRQFTNVPLLRIYRGIAYELFEAHGQKFSKKRLVNLVKEPALLDFAPGDDEKAFDTKSYNFEFIVPLSHVSMLYPEMLKAVNTYSEYTATLELQNRKCLVLKRSPSAENKAVKNSRNELSVDPRPLASLVNDVNDMSFTELPLIDESAYKGDLYIDLTHISSLDSLKKVFETEGFQVQEANRELLMMVLRDK
ncbi:TlpA family protein disulfide reductase [Kaistella daneshvariae]|uniref:TlpA family protein disulfide reductase n=1 Tax=Kaistella daneshvariae TaxID=2487074 RepID=A0ABM7C6M1_9FLAO|nr:TlpA disulfide reductase family protein [Kaistella daneshvariae]AZI66607.1 TlpA family protein disulfide reductase [Kaistella daneshvariae]